MLNKLSSSQDNYEIIADGKTVWVNSATGMCIGRFTARAVDVHHDEKEQMQGEHCLDCFAYPANERPQAWEKFKESMKRHYQIIIPDSAAPVNL